LDVVRPPSFEDPKAELAGQGFGGGAKAPRDGLSDDALVTVLEVGLGPDELGAEVQIVHERLAAFSDRDMAELGHGLR
jgi:hypothetical protein